MKKTLKKLLVCILIVLTINNFFFNNICFAADDPVGEWIEDMLSAVVGLLTWPIRIVALACAWAIDGLTTNVALLEGYVDSSGNIVEDNPYADDDFSTLTPFHILFNKIALLDVNFFNLLNNGSVVSNIRNSIAGWYYVMRMIAAAILLCVLIYVGIRMAITTIASDKAAYKKMLVDWITSLALIFLLQYIILFTFAVNEALVKSMSGISNSKDLTDAIKNIGIIAQGVSAASIAATIAFCMLTAQTLGLLISYFNRMLKIAFLIIISPLITLTYSIDKMGDGKAQALNAWLKEFIYTVLLQAFHCIIYMVFVGMALAILNETKNANLLDGERDSITIAGAVLVVFCVKFTKDAEKILGKIFDFSGSTSDSSLAVGMAASAMALTKAKGLGKGARTAVNGLKGAKGAIGNALRTSKIEAMALGAMLHGARNADGSRKTFAEAKDDAETEVSNAEAEKAELKNAKKYGVQTKGDSEEAKKYQERVSKLTQQNKDAGMSESLAVAKARAQVAKETRAEKVRTDPKGAWDKAKNLWKYNKVRGTISAVRNVASQSEVLKELGNLGKMSVAAGVGTFVGSASYGTSGNAFNAFSLGAASYKGTKEFMKSSTKTLTNEMSQLFKGAGYEDVAAASAGITTIMQDSDKYEKADDEIKRILEQLDGALAGLESNDKDILKSKIKNVVNNEMTRNPAATNNDIMQKLLGHSQISQELGLSKDADGKVVSSKAGVTDTLGEFSNFKRNKIIYETVKNAGNIGVSPDAFIQSSIEKYQEDLLAYGAPSEKPEDAEKREQIISSVAEGGTISDKDIQDYANSPEQRKAFEKAVESEVASLMEQKTTLAEAGVYSTPEIDAKIASLEKALHDVADEGSKVDKAAYEKAKQKLEDERRDALNDLKAMGDTITIERTKLEAKIKEYEALIKYNESQMRAADREKSKYGTPKKPD